MKIRWIVVVILIVMLGGVLNAQDDADQFRFQTLEDGAPLSNVFEGDVNAHLYVFQGSSGDSVSISMVQEDGSQLDPYVVLLGASGEVFIANDDDGEVPLSALIDSFELPTDGTYFVLATSFDGIRNPVLLLEGESEPEPLFYEIVVSGITTPADASDNPDVFAGEIEPGGSVNVAITVEEPVFYLTFMGTEGDTATVSTSNDGDGDSVDTLLYLFDPEGNRIAVNDDNGENFFSSLESTELPADGRYMIFATAFDFHQTYAEDWTGFGTFNVDIR